MRAQPSLRWLPVLLGLAVACSQEEPTQRVLGPMAAIGVDPNTGATIETNKDDYVPGEIVHVTGSGWAPGETVNLHMTEDPDTHEDVDQNVDADSTGAFSVHYYDVQEHDLGVTFTLVATGLTSGSSATATFSDGNVTAATTPTTHAPNAAVCAVGSKTTFSLGEVVCAQTTITVASPPAPAAGDLRIQWVGPSPATTVALETPKSGIDGSIQSDQFTPAATGTWTVRVCKPTGNCATGALLSSATFTVTAAGPTKLVFTTVPFTKVVGQCSGTVTVATKNALDVLTSPTSDLTVGLGTTSGGGAFYSDNACTAPITSVTILTSGNTASFFYKDMTVGGPTLTASATGLTDAMQIETITQASTTTGVVTDGTPSTYGANVKFTATVTATSPGSGTPAGTVAFKDGTDCTTGVQIDVDQTLNGSGQAEVTTNGLQVGSHTIWACYAGNTNYGSSSGSVAQTVDQAATTTVASASPSPSVYGQSVTFKAKVTWSGGNVTSGNVKFFLGTACSGTQIGSDAALNGSGEATVSTSTLAASVTPYDIKACFQGTTNLATSDGATTHTVNKATTSLELTDDVDPTVLGESFTLTAAVTITAPGAGTLAGTVYFYQSGTCASPGTSIGSDATSPYEVTTTLPVGSYPALLACYKDDPNFADSHDTEAHTVKKAATSLVLTDDVDPTVYGESFTLTAAVSITAPGAGTLTGTVYFYRSGTCDIPGTANGSDGTYPYQVATTLPVGSYPALLACYKDDPDFDDSFGTQAHTVNKALTSLVLTDDADPTVYGESFNLTAAVSITAPGAGTLAGTVYFYESGSCASPGTAIGSDGTSLYQVSPALLAVGSYPALLACYKDDPNFEDSFGTQAHTVDKATTTTDLTSTANPSVWGQSVTFNAIVSITAPGGGTLNGTVSFYDFGVGEDCTSPGTALETDPVATASYTSSSLTVGSHSIGACYNGSSSYEKSGDGLTQVVNKASTTTTVTTSGSPSTFGESVTFTAEVKVTAPGAGTPTGTVRFYEFTAGQSCDALGGATALTSGTLPGAAPFKTTYVTNALDVAGSPHTISACYEGDGHFETSGGSVSQTVNPATTTTVASVPTLTPQYSDEATLKATVTPHTILGSELTGTVRFYLRSAAVSCPASIPAIGTVDATDDIAAADDGVAEVDYAVPLEAGNYVLTACFYSTNANFGNSNDTESPVAIGKENAEGFTITNVGSAQVGVTSFQVVIGIKEARLGNGDEPDQNAGQLPGDITNVPSLTATASPENGGSGPTGLCTNNGVFGGTGYSAYRKFTCTFTSGSALAVDVYTLTFTVGGNYYTGTYEDIFSIWDPNAGFATGGGWFLYDGTSGDKTSFGFSFTMTKGKTSVRGSIVVVRHLPGGGVCRAKSNQMTAPSVVGNKATLGGKGNYSCVIGGITTVSQGNLNIIAVAEDNATSGAGADKFRVQVTDQLNMAALVLLGGGNVQVPQPSGPKP